MVSVSAILTIIALAYSAYMATKLPAIVPTHWDAAGKVNQYGSKWISLLVMPGSMVFTALLAIGLPAISPEKFKIDSFRNTYNYIMVLVIGMMTVLHIVILEATLNGSFPLERVMAAVLFAFFALMGNVLGKVRRNFWMGIRTPWTLADERVWDQTHRMAARIWTIGGALGVILALIGVTSGIWLTYLMAIALWPAIMSYVIYRRIGGSTTTF
jgi:uncharacterized membrane protein